MIGIIFRRITAQVEIRVVSHVDNGLLVCCGAILDVNSVIVSQREVYLYLNIAWKVHVSVWRVQCQLYLSVTQLLAVKNFVLPSLRTTVKAVVAIVRK